MDGLRFSSVPGPQWLDELLLPNTTIVSARTASGSASVKHLVRHGAEYIVGVEL
jgi:hypothetical protein